MITKALVFAVCLSIGLQSCRSFRPEIQSDELSKLSKARIHGSFSSSSASTSQPFVAINLSLQRLPPAQQRISRSFQDPKVLASHQAPIEVPYGTYTLLMSYQDNSGKTVFESCASEKLKEHKIDGPNYEVDVAVCEANASTQVGSVNANNDDPNKPGSNQGGAASDVTLKPVIQPNP